MGQILVSYEQYVSHIWTISGAKFEGYVPNGSKTPEISGSTDMISPQGADILSPDTMVNELSSLLSLLSLDCESAKGDPWHSRGSSAE